MLATSNRFVTSITFLLATVVFRAAFQSLLMRTKFAPGRISSLGTVSKSGPDSGRTTDVLQAASWMAYDWPIFTLRHEEDQMKVIAKLTSLLVLWILTVSVRG